MIKRDFLKVALMAPMGLLGIRMGTANRMALPRSDIRAACDNPTVMYEELPAADIDVASIDYGYVWRAVASSTAYPRQENGRRWFSGMYICRSDYVYETAEDALEAGISWYKGVGDVS